MSFLQVHSPNLSRHLDFLVDQTEKFSTALAEDLQGAHVPLQANPFADSGPYEPDSFLREAVVPEPTDEGIAQHHSMTNVVRRYWV